MGNRTSGHQWGGLVCWAVLGMALSMLLPSYGYGASSGDQGVGVMLGNPTGVSGKFWLDDRVAIDGAFGIAQGELDTHVTLLLHDEQLLKTLGIQKTSSAKVLPVYIGAGPRILFDDDTEVGLRVPLGLSYFPDKSEWEFFGELAPVIRFTPSSGLDLDFAVGARYYFKAIRPKN